jgi:DNA-binding MarR family transcriptional regulator
MTISETLSKSIARWVDVFMFRSLQDLLQFLKENGMTMTHYTIFMQIYKLGPCSVTKIAGLLNISKPAASQMVERLVEQGLLGREEDILDRRVTRVALTSAGCDLTRACISARTQWLEDLPALSESQQLAIVSALDELTAAALPLLQSAAHKK